MDKLKSRIPDIQKGDNPNSSKGENNNTKRILRIKHKQNWIIRTAGALLIKENSIIRKNKITRRLASASAYV
jgi:hypothetical protein